MCGRFVLTTPAQALAEHFDARGDTLLLAPRYNIAPTQSIVAVRVENGQRRLVMLRWGLIPSWAKDPAAGGRPMNLFNARSESAAEKPSFRNALRRRRCIVPASGFYEWKREGTRKQPWYFRPAGDGPLAIAALWESWQSPDGAEVETCALLTTEANALMASVHDRMPVLLSPAQYGLWLDPQIQDPRQIETRIQPLLVPARDEVLTAYPVGSDVGNARCDVPSNIEPLRASAQQSDE